jgi:hypothetical protein
MADLSLADIYLVTPNRYERCPIRNIIYDGDNANYLYSQAINRFGVLIPQTWVGIIVVCYIIRDKMYNFTPAQVLGLVNVNPFAVLRLYLLVASNGYINSPEWSWLYDHVTPNVSRYLRVYVDIRQVNVLSHSPCDITPEWFEWPCLNCGQHMPQNHYYLCGHGICRYCNTKGCIACIRRQKLAPERRITMDTMLEPLLSWTDHLNN